MKEAFQARFRPEFLNRTDETIDFHPLDKRHIRRIVDIQMSRLAKQADKAGIALECSDVSIDEIATLGYDPPYGDRPPKRMIQQLLQHELARELLSGKFSEGTPVRIDFVQDRISLATIA